MGLISPKLRQSARGQDCMFRIPGVCNGDPETTVLCHLYPDGGVMAGKTPDFISSFGCSACHEHIDQHRMDREFATFYSFRGMARTWSFWVEKGLIVVSGIDPDKPKTRPGKKANLPSKTLPRRPMAHWRPPTDRERD